MIVITGAGPVELDETDIPAHLVPRARAWFEREVKSLERIHGREWPAVKDWLAGYLREELRELVAKEQGRSRSAPPRREAQR